MSGLKTPKFEVKIGGKDFSNRSELMFRVHEIEVEQVIDGPWSCKVVLDDSDGAFSTGELAIREEETLLIKIGYQDGISPTTVFEGEVSGIQSDRRPEQRKLITVRGFCPLQRLSRGRKRRSWQNITDNDLASLVAGEHGMQASTGEVKIKHPYVMQNNVTNLAFLYERARRIGYMVNAKGKTLSFKEPDLSSTCKLVWDASTVTESSGTTVLKDFKVESATPGQLKEVTSRFWDPKKKEAMTVSSGEVHGQTMGGKHTGGEFTGASNQVSDQPFRSIEEGEVLAKSHLNQRAMGFMSGTGQCEGNPLVEAGRVIDVDAKGEELDGQYYVSRAVHRLKAGAGSGFGYETDFEAMRTGR